MQQAQPRIPCESEYRFECVPSSRREAAAGSWFDSPSPITPVIDPIFGSVDGILPLILSIIRPAVRSIADAITALLTEVLLVLNTVGSVIPPVDPPFHAIIKTRRNRDGRTDPSICPPRDAW